MPAITKWDGVTTKLPLVNQSCQYKVNGGKNWFECTVVAYHGEGFHHKVWLVKSDDKANATPIHRVREIEFRASPEPINALVDGAIADVLELGNEANAADINLVRKMIKAGYRKVPKCPNFGEFTEGGTECGDRAADLVTYGIHLPNHGNIIEVHRSRELRDYILKLLKLGNSHD